MVEKVHPFPKLQFEPTDSQCKICFDYESAQKKLISPCKCTGSIEYVHEDCLKTWISLSNQNIELSKCDICKQEFKMEIELCKTCFLDTQNEGFFKFLIFFLIILVISGILVIVMFFLISRIRTNQLSLDEKLYFSLIISFCFLIISVLAIGFIKSIRSTCIRSRVRSWKILSSPKENIYEETFVVTNQDYLINRPTELTLLTVRNREASNYKVEYNGIPHLKIELVAHDKDSFIPQSYRRSGLHTERLPESRLERIVEHQFTARINS